MTNPRIKAANPRASETTSDEVLTIAILHTGRSSAERYDLGRLFLEFMWSSRFPNGWIGGVRGLATTIRRLKRSGVIERRTVRFKGRPTHHGFVLTELGHETLRT